MGSLEKQDAWLGQPPGTCSEGRFDCDNVAGGRELVDPKGWGWPGVSALLLREMSLFLCGHKDE